MTRLAKIILISLGAIAIVVVTGVIVLPVVYAPAIKRMVVDVLEDRFGSAVEIRNLQVSPVPRIRVFAEGIVLRHKGRTDVPPLMTIEKLSISANVMGLLHSPKRVSSVHLQGLQIHVPPPGNNEPEIQPKKHFAPDVLVEEIISDDALLETLPRNPAKQPRDFHIHTLVLRQFGFDGPASFHAVLTNPAPVGQIDSEGQFGPWKAEEPGDTPISAGFTFSKADLGTLRGIAGILSSTGKYSGTLDHLDVEGDTDTPDFALNIGGNAV